MWTGEKEMMIELNSYTHSPFTMFFVEMFELLNMLIKDEIFFLFNRAMYNLLKRSVGTVKILN